MNTSNLRSVSLQPLKPLPERYPFSVPAVRALKKIDFVSPVTFLLGENGTGKSTLLEGIASAAELPCVGRAEVSRDSTLSAARELGGELRLMWGRRSRRGLFMRAEDVAGFTLRMRAEQDDLRDAEEDFGRRFTGYARELAQGAVRGQRAAIERRYGENPDGRSHGEIFLGILRSRLHPGGLFLMDEPETPLSFSRQLALLGMIRETVAAGGQFIIATHSPVLAALPEASLLYFRDGSIERAAWDDIDNFSDMRRFLNGPEAFLRHL